MEREREKPRGEKKQMKGERERKGELKKKTHTVRVMCVGVVLHVYKPAAYLALLFPKKVKRDSESTQMLIHAPPPSNDS